MEYRGFLIRNDKGHYIAYRKSTGEFETSGETIEECEADIDATLEKEEREL